MMIYTKSGVKSKKSYARVYLRDEGPVVRFYFSDVDAHRQFIEQAPAHIKEAFTREHGKCDHCHNQKDDGSCKHRKSYTIDGTLYEKCDGITFEFWQPGIEKIPDYTAIFTEFYPARKKK